MKRRKIEDRSPSSIRSVSSCLTMSAQKKRKVEFGSNHPDIHRDLERVKSSPDEMKYVARYAFSIIRFYIVVLIILVIAVSSLLTGFQGRQLQ